MQPYDDALTYILKNGKKKSDRTGIGTLYVCGIQSRYSLVESFPVLTRRKINPRAVFAELIWFLSGSSNNRDLVEIGAKFWTPWVSEEFEKKNGFNSGDFGPIYGHQLRHFGSNYKEVSEIREEIRKLKALEDFNDYDQGEVEWLEGKLESMGTDQLKYMTDRLKNNPTDRRILFSLWNPSELDKMRLPPCHYTYQVTVDDDGLMTGMLTQRSCDFPVGVPANIQFYSALTCMFAQQFGFKPYEFVHSTVDSHIYLDQISAVEEYLATPVIESPTLELNRAPDMVSYKVDDFKLLNFNQGPNIKVPVAV